MTEGTKAEQSAGEDREWSRLSRDLAVDVLVHGAQSRSSLAERMGVSAATVTRLVRPLLAAGVLTETEVLRTPGRGRSALAVDIVADRFFVGVKLTAETMYAVVTDVRARVLHHVSLPLRSHDVAIVVEAVAQVVLALRAEVGVEVSAVGVTVGGRVEAGDVVVDSPFLGWHDVPLRSLLAEVLGVPVHLENDVVGLTESQQWFGVGKAYPSFALVTVGAGVGYGLVVGGERVSTAVSPIAHVSVDPAGPLCPQGHRGCVSAYLTSDAVAWAASARLRRTVGFAEALSLAERGEEAVVPVVAEAAHVLGRLASIISATTGVERIILSGEGVYLADIARRALDDAFHANDLRDDSPCELVIRPMGFVEWARGAAVVAVRREFPILPEGEPGAHASAHDAV